MSSAAKFREIISNHDNFLLVCHERPDGDCIGALLALGEALERAGKKVTLISKDPVPPVFQFLSGSERIQNDFLLGNYEAVVLLDNGDLRRTGFPERFTTLRKKAMPLINIDHHPKNDIWKLCSLNLADTAASSTCELMYNLFQEHNITITPKIATALLTGIFTDTGGFQHSNTSPQVLEITSCLLNRGAKLRAISANISHSHSTAMLKLWGVALNRLKVNEQFGLAYSILTHKDIKQVGASEDEVSGLVNLINSIPESRAALLLYETADGKIKGSLRTESEEIDLSQLAGLFGGGGHKKASGFSLSGELQEQGDAWQVI